MDELLGTTDVALLLKCSAEWIRQLERQGKIKAMKTTKGTRVFKRSDIDAYIALQKEKDESKLALKDAIKHSKAIV